MDCSLPGSYVHGIFQARIPELVAISSFKGFSELIAQLVKNPPAIQETLVGFLAQDDKLEMG